MRILDTSVTQRQRDLQQVWDLLTDTHRLAEGDAAPACNYWSFCRFESWMVYSAPGQHADAGLERRLHLWKTEAEQLLGLAVVEGRGRDFHVITHPNHRDIEPAIITSMYIGANPDTGHFEAAGVDPLEQVEKLAGRIYHVHFKDSDQRLPLGAGTVDLPGSTRS